MLLPEAGDDPTQYETQDIGAGRQALKRKADGSCWYLGPGGCEIHGRHPAICKAYDCAAQWRSLSREDRRRGIAKGYLSKAVMDAGRARAEAAG